MRAIILAAGRGSRMGDHTNTLPKCRTVYKEKELFQWQIDALKGAGINDIAVATGYLAETFPRDFSHLKLHFFHNPIWDKSNMVKSLSMATEWLESSPCIVTYSDIIYNKKSVEALMASDGDISLLYDHNWRSLWEKRFERPLDDAETFKLDAETNTILEIGKKTNSYSDIEGQFMGLMKFTPNGWLKIQNYFNTLNDQALNKLDSTSLLQNLIERDVKLQAVKNPGPWLEVDQPSDLNVDVSL